MIETVTKNYLDGEFINYIMVKNGITSFVPLDEANRHYQEIQEWAAIDGNNITDPGA
jgi:hypothetical protein